MNVSLTPVGGTKNQSQTRISIMTSMEIKNSKIFVYIAEKALEKPGGMEKLKNFWGA
jgi:hypothetical protein